MNDRGGMYMLGKVILVMVVLLVVFCVLAVLGWSNHQMKAAQADLLRVNAEQMRAELEAQIPYMPAVEAEQAQQLIAQLRSEGLTREQMDRIAREAMVFNEQLRQSQALADLSFKQGMYQNVINLTYALGLAFIVVPAALVTYVLFLNVRERAEDRALLRAAQAAPVAQPAARPAAPAPRPARSVTPVTGRLPDLPQGRPVREGRPPAAPQPAAPRPLVDVPALTIYQAPRPAQPQATAVVGNGYAPYLSGNGHSNGIYRNGNGR